MVFDIFACKNVNDICDSKFDIFDQKFLQESNKTKQEESNGINQK